MKKLSLSIVLVVAALLMTQCRKAGVQPVNGGTSEPFGDFEMTLTAGNGDDKSSIEGLSIYWQLGDKLHVVDSNDMRYLGYLTATEIGDSKTTATFKGFITQPTANHRCKFYFVGSNNFNIDDEGNYLFDVHEQYGGLSIYVGNAANDDYESDEWRGDFNDVSNGLQLMKNRNAITVDETMLAAHNFGDQIIHMRSMMAIAHINLQVNGTSMGGELTDIVTVTGEGCIAKAKLNIKTGALTAVTGEKTITLKKANNDYYMVLIPASQTEATSQALTFTATSENGEELGITPMVQANKFYNKDGAMKIKMCETSEWICFNDPDMGVSDLPKWAKYNLGVDHSNLNEIIDWYGDYYAWGEIEPYYADGHAHDNPCSDWRTMTTGAGNTVISNGYVWQTYSQGSSSSYAEWTNHPFGSDNNLIPTRDVVRIHPSWGGEWRMPTGGAIDASGNGEWQELFNNTLFVLTENYKGVNNLKGYVVFKVKNVADKSGTAGFMTSNYPDGVNNGGYKVNDDRIYSVNADANYQPHMFLPFAGGRAGTLPDEQGTMGYYWSSSIFSDHSMAYLLRIQPTIVNPQKNHGRFYGFSVRPVR